jgi:ferritin-like protein
MVKMQHFSYAHLRPDLASVSQSFAELAHAVLNTLPNNAERTTCLRKLLEAKDCAVRAYLEGHTTVPAEPPEAVQDTDIPVS